MTNETETKKNGNAKQITCRVCGQLFGTPTKIKQVVKRVNLNDKLAETCPKCRGMAYRERLTH